MKGLAVTLAVIVGTLVGFYGGFHTGRGSTTTAAAAAVTRTPRIDAGGTAATPGATGGRGTGGGGFGRGNVGTVSGASAAGFTIHNPTTGADIKVVFDPAVQVRKTVSGQVSDIQDGMTVVVLGQAGADGTVTATSVQITTPPATGG